MVFRCDVRLPDEASVITLEGAGRKPLTEPTKLVRECIEREGGKVTSLYGTNGGWDCFCIFEAQSPEAQIRACLAMHTAGLVTDTKVCIDELQLDRAWQDAISHPVTAGR